MSNYYYQPQQHQQPPPQQQPYYHEAYPMYDMNNNAVRPTTADGYYKEPYYPESTERYARYNTSPPMSCCDRVCCGCCTCCPRWCRWISCILFILIIALAIVIGVLASQFKVPKVDFTGIQGTPQFNINNTVLSVNASLGFTVNNPNIESITFTSLDAEIYYHGYGNTSIGQGSIKDLHISSNGYTNFVFPFTLKVDITSPQDQAIASKLMSDCGIGGGQAQKINLDYKVVATVNIIGISIHVPYSSSASFDCPMNSPGQQDVLNKISQMLPNILGTSTTSSLLSKLPSLLSTKIS
ncbi:hypothetical protein BCV72DRAFT_242718 [Rhizopus microsporus var. microsporus]|uniref:Late embryogenesis abundant protein LEA-2 subgroup domain-containing protein n=2 Tax=Rhizopus microsporus TaxID=58291 RepID=A0A2G4T6N8_RHIZD|nr:uncharacterized protein RHIMIDRAFT_247159 [Rhizopus microsporus ATCC 52813]ORE05554.1 hypothetical protein BCV72DRAFT_242718 [Rhizopus microsporus var. microsporus]PHZ16668.1 hypothetical protein RHIMIDRAFT_247159 [Rhizopus microsporus ATCC 52813]